jgi:hypothetical protein
MLSFVTGSITRRDMLEQRNIQKDKDPQNQGCGYLKSLIVVTSQETQKKGH